MLWVLLCIVNSASAKQDSLYYPKPYYQLKTEVIGTEKGLSQSYAVCMAFDKQGYLWVGTLDGLNRYDGTGFKVFKHDVNDTNSIRDNQIAKILVDSKDRIWIMDESYNVYLFDRQTERFILVYRPNLPTSMQYEHIEKCLVEDYLGRIIVGGSTETYIITDISTTGGRANFQTAPLADIYPELTERMRSKIFEVNRHLIDNRLMICRTAIFRDFWGNNSRDECLIYTQEILKSKAEPIQVILHNQKLLHSFNQLENYRYGLYIFGDDGTLMILNDKKNRFDTLLALPRGKYNHQRSFVDQDNTFWTFVSPALLLRVDLSSGAIDSIRIVNEVLANPYEHGGIFFKDDNDNIWVGTNGVGLIKLNTKQTLFKHLDTHTAHQGLSQYRHAVAGNGQKLDIGITHKWAEFIKMKRHDSLSFILLPSYFYAVDKNGDFYKNAMSTDSALKHICKIEPENNTYKVLYSGRNQLYQWLGQPIFLDKNDELWMGDRLTNNVHVLCHIDKENGGVTSYAFPVPAIFRGAQFISDWYITPGNIFWLATINGLFSFDPGTKKWKTYQNVPGDTNTISLNYLMSVCPDGQNPERFLWIGTKGAGLNKFDITTGRATHYDKHRGLPDDVVYGVQTDHDKNLWLSTNNGLCHFNPSTGETYNFSVDDGLPGNEFNSYQYAKDDSGRMFFAGINGGILFHPKEYYTSRTASKTIINKLKLLNNEVQYHYAKTASRADDYLLPAPVEQCRELIFNHDAQMITLGFVVLDYTTPHKNNFKYILEGLHDEWINAGTQNEATFSGLNAGTYTFKVIGRNSSGMWSKEPATIKITILPPWWGTWWFRVSVLLATVGILYAFYRYRLNQLLKVERMRNDIAQDLHDEIGSTLSSISLYGTIIKRNAQGMSEKAASLVDKITGNTKEMMESMNDIVWTTKTNNDTLAQLVNRMRAFAASTTEAKDIKLQFGVQGRVEHVNIDMESRKNIYLLFKEALNNAIKHSECSVIQVAIKADSKRMELMIKDNGKGFNTSSGWSENTETMGGNGMGNMQSRAGKIGAEFVIDSSVGSGTTVMLTVSLK